MSGGPLSGIRIIEAGHMLAGPYCGMLLADLGAEVIKIEPPGGDIARRIGPHYVGQHNAYFASLNRNKKSVVLDLTEASGQRELGRLAARSHGLITNLRPAAIRKLGLDFEHLKAFNPRIVCVALTGYGLSGNYADKPAYDYVIQAVTGVMMLTGDPDGPPIKAGYSAVDNSTGIMAALGFVAKLVEGKGGQVDVSLHDAMLSQLNYLASAVLNGHETPRRLPDGGHPYLVPAQLFRTSDGHVVIFVSHDGFWRRFARELAMPDWLTDARFATMEGRSENRSLVVGAVQEQLLKASTDEWVRRLSALGVVVAGVGTLDKALEGEVAKSRNMVVTIDTDDGPVRVVGNPIKCSQAPDSYRPPPTLGEHNDTIA